MLMFIVVFGICMFFFTLNIERSSPGEWIESIVFFLLPLFLVWAGLLSPYQIDVDDDFIYLSFFGDPKKIAWDEILALEGFSTLHPFTLVLHNSYYLSSKRLGFFNLLFGILYFNFSPIVIISPKQPEHYRLINIIEEKIKK